MIHFHPKILKTGLLHAQKNAKRMEKVESKVSLLRLGVILGSIFMMGFWLTENPSFFLIFVFFILFIVVMLVLRWHQKCQENLKKWLAIVESLKASLSRVERNFGEMEQKKPSWQQNWLLEEEGNHPYFHDLDLDSHLQLLWNTCSTKKGSLALCELLTSLKYQFQEERKNRLERIASLAKCSSVLRRLELFRYHREFIQTQKVEYQENSLVHLGTGAWIGIFAFLSFWGFVVYLLSLKTFSIEMVLMAGLAYMAILWGANLSSGNISSQLHSIRGSLQWWMSLNRAFFKISEKKEFSSYKVLSSETYRNIKSVYKMQGFLTLRSNPIAWIAVHLFIPFDSLVILLLKNKWNAVKEYKNIYDQESAFLDAECALARYATEDFHANISYDFSLETSYPFFENIGHPLVKPSSRVLNSLVFSSDSSLMILTGSNMSGKSTFLRSVGINSILYSIGAPLCGEKVALSFLRVFCAIRVDDSTANQTSYFFAEVQRLKDMMERLERKENLLILIDEIFRGTNNKERFVGSWHILSALGLKGVPTIVSTHDLALTELSQKQKTILNYHFKEHYENKELCFDYKIKDGPCPSTNALYIMKNAGLPVPSPEEIDME